MSEPSNPPSVIPPFHWKTRIFSIVSLALLVVGVGHGGRLTYQAMTDAWVAPIRLSPDNDRIVALRLERTRQQTDRGRLESELTGIDEELKAIDLAIERLATIDAGYTGARTWTIRAQQQERGALTTEARTLEQERAMLVDLLDARRTLVERSRADRSSGIITSTQLDRETLELNQLEVALKNNERELGKVRAAQQIADYRSASLTSREPAAARSAIAAAQVRSPEVVKFDEQQIRIELEVSRMHAERRAAESKRRTIATSLAAIKQIEDDLQSRPLYRAMNEQTDLAFVPYSQMGSVGVGNEVYQCTWGVFFCRPVGNVKELVAGEVVTQDPWGDVARGQYVVLAMSVSAALNERVLRVGARSRRATISQMLSLR